MLKNKSKKSSGFIALISALIISTILLGLLMTSSNSGLSTRINLLHREFRRQSKNLADSCTHTVLRNILDDYVYTPQLDGDTISIDSNSCTIDSVTYSTETAQHTKTATILTHAQFRGAWTTIQTVAQIVSPQFSHIPPLEPITITSWNEI